jgi:hypothetical protein
VSEIHEERDPVRYLEAERVFRDLGLSIRAARSLIRAGILGPTTLARTPWTDEEAGARYSSLSWRLSVDPACDAKILAEVERVRSQLGA